MVRLFVLLQSGWSRCVGITCAVRWTALKFVCFGFVLFAVLSSAAPAFSFWEGDPDDREAATVQQDIFGDTFSSVEYVDQGWTPSDSLWFYTITQGSDLLPYDFFMALEQVGASELFRSNENMNTYRYLPQRASTRNPDGLPVGFVKDHYQGMDYMGFTCAACHTGQMNYKGTAIRIDGAPAGSDVDSFLRDLSTALRVTLADHDVRARFIQKVLDRGHFASENAVIKELEKVSLRMDVYTAVNYSPTEYGYARLDAFGRIYNRTLEHIMSEKQIRSLLRNVLTEKDLIAILGDVDGILNAEERSHIVERIMQLPDLGRKDKLMKQIFNRPDAPVSYPFLWDIPQHDYVQWNGLAGNAGLGPIGRNAGEVIGVFATLDWSEKRGTSLSSLIGGQKMDDTHINFRSSINVHNLRRIESHLWGLKSPKWPETILPPIDWKRSARGEPLFNQYCASCHAEIDRADPNRRVVAHMSKLDEIGTDPKMAENSVQYSGFSGILKNLYVKTDVGSILLNERAPVAGLLTKVIVNVASTPDPDKIFLRRWAEWAYDLVSALFKNDIKASVKNGDYHPDTTANPYASLLSYKARSLNGIWATAPYLHNGSVPTLYDLLLPKKRSGDPEDGARRPETFHLGSREFDPFKVGFVSSGYDGFIFSTEFEGNSNAGHEYGTMSKLLPNGKTLPALTQEERLDLLEYLKTL